MNRKKAEAELLRLVGAIENNSTNFNVNLYKETLKGMSDTEFKKMMQSFRDGEDYIRIIEPNFRKNGGISIENNVKVAKTLGKDFFQQVWMVDPATQTKYLTPFKYLLLMLPLRRQSQALMTKISVPKDNKSVDVLTGQPTMSSKGGKLSIPDTQVLYSLGLTEVLREGLKGRGGDRGAMNAIDNDIIETGQSNLSNAYEHGTGVKSTQTFDNYLKGMHITTKL